MFPEFLLHHAYTYLWNRLYSGFPAFQLALLDGDDVVAEAHALSIPWDGSIEGLPAGWGPAFELGMTTDLLPTALSMLSIGVLPSRQGEGLGARMLEASRDAARAEGLATVLAPVRPTLKDRYPLVPVEEYVTWRRPDGSHFDPWIRLHERAGADIDASAPESLAIEAHVADWERWTGMALPTDGDYVVPNMLAPLVVRGGIGRHAEPNVWMRHRLS
ncbi:MAG TPA: GNAT family N-acetyltransferase [Gaiellaceae bacterium]|nr:GNAT family N-acetyltransferase [Gaiellaceae bacterium]